MATSSNAHPLHSFGRMTIPSTTCSTAPRHQRSLESILDFRHQALSTSQRILAEKLLTQIFNLCVSPSTTQDFDRVSLLRLSLEYNPSPEGRDNFLGLMLRHYLPDGDGGRQDADMEDWRFGAEFSNVLEELDWMIWEWKETPPEWVINATKDLADHFVYYFFLPSKLNQPD
jgi:hypothetical protein